MTETGMKLMTTAALLSSPSFLLPAYNGLKQSNLDVVASTGRLASGNRILQAGEDAASLSIAAQLQSDASVLHQASRNAAEGDSITQVAVSALEDISDILDTLSVLATDATATSLTDSQRGLLQAQIDSGLEDIDTIVENTRFADFSLLDGTLAAGGDTQFQVGANSGDVIEVVISDVGTSSLFSGGLPDVTSAANAAIAETRIETASNTVQQLISSVEAAGSRFVAADKALASTRAGANEARSSLLGTDVEAELAAFIKKQLQLDYSTSIVAQAQGLQSKLLDVLQFKIEAAKVEETIEEPVVEEPVEEPDKELDK